MFSLSLDKVMTDTSGGAYLYLDPQDRAVLADSAFHLRRFAHDKGPDGKWRFTVTDDWDLSGYLPTTAPHGRIRGRRASATPSPRSALTGTA